MRGSCAAARVRVWVRGAGAGGGLLPWLVLHGRR